MTISTAVGHIADTWVIGVKSRLNDSRCLASQATGGTSRRPLYHIIEEQTATDKTNKRLASAQSRELDV
jgi:hypothetical protein